MDIIGSSLKRSSIYSKNGIVSGNGASYIQREGVGAVIDFNYHDVVDIFMEYSNPNDATNTSELNSYNNYGGGGVGWNGASLRLAPDSGRIYTKFRLEEITFYNTTGTSKTINEAAIYTNFLNTKQDELKQDPFNSYPGETLAANEEKTFKVGAEGWMMFMFQDPMERELDFTANNYTGFSVIALADQANVNNNDVRVTGFKAHQRIVKAY